MLAVLAWAPTLVWAAADPQVTSVVDSPDPVPAGGVVTYTVQVDNNDNQTARGVQVTFSMPSGATFISATSAAAVCTLTTPTLVTCSLGSIGTFGSDPRTLVFKWRANGPGPDTLNATIALTADNDANPTNNVQTAQTTVINGANLALTKTGSPNPVVGGANVTYTLTASNPTGPNDSGDLTLVDTLPPSVSFVSAAGSGWSCSNSGQTVTCNRAGPHPVGVAIPPVTVVGKVNAAGGTITNVATLSPAATGGVPDPDASDNTATADTTVTPGADVRINQKTVISALPATAGSDVSFRIEPRNNGPVAAASPQVDDTLPPGWTLVSASGPNWTCAAVAGNPRCTRASLPVGATDDITVVATAPTNVVVPAAGQTYTNTASITAATADPNLGNNSGAVNVQVVRDGADLRLAKTKTPNPVALGATLTSRITVTNGGPRRATGPLQVVEQLNGETFNSASGTGWSCTVSGSTVTCVHANAAGLSVNASLPVLTLLTTATAADSQASNTACTGSSLPPGASGVTAQPPVEGDPNPANDCATANALSTTVQPDLAIAKTTVTTNGDTTVDTNEGSVTYQVVVSNVSVAPQNATGVVIRDTVPAFIAGRTTITPLGTVTSTGGVPFNCVISNAVVTCTQAGGSFAQGDTVTVPITVNRPMQDGSFTNTATVANTAQGDPNANNNSASAPVTILPIADVEVSAKTVTPASIRAGETATYVVSYRNNGPSTATNVVLTDSFTLPPGDPGLLVTSISSSKAGSTCTLTAGTVLSAGGTQGYTCNLGSLANGETQTVTLRVRPLFISGNAGGRSFVNTASITTTTVENPAGGDNGNNSKTAILGVAPSLIDLLVNKTDAVDPVGFNPAGQTFIDYRVRVTSNGPSYGTAVSIDETMTPPAGRRVRFVCDTTALASGTCNATPLCTGRNATSVAGTPLPTFSCQVPAGNATTGPAVGELAPGQSKDLFLRFEVLDAPDPTGDVYRNEARAVSGNEPDSFAGNDSQTEPTTVRNRIDLRTTKTTTNASPGLNEPFEWVVTVVNNGPGSSRQTDLTDVLPAGVQATGTPTWTRTSPAGSGNCAVTGQTVSCALGQLDAGGQATVRLSVRVSSYPSGGSLTNTATVDTDPAKTGGVDTPGGNNSGTSTITVQRASLTGLVFEDRVRDGSNGGTPQAPAQEPRIAGVTVTLTGVDAYGNAITRTAVSDASGTYAFASLPASGPGGYTLTQTQPGTHANGPVAVPSSGPLAPSAGGTYAAGGLRGNSTYTGVVLGLTTGATQYHFPEQLLPAAPSLSGTVYIDRDANGLRDPATDPGIAGATLRLLNAATNAVLATTTTDASGVYRFTGLDPALRYTLEQPLPTAPAGLVPGGVNPGLVGGLPCASGCTASPDGGGAGVDRITDIDLSSGTDGTGFDFGERQEGVISGTVYIDRNRNNVLDPTPTDGRIAGVTLTLYAGGSCSGTALATVQTDAAGNYAFPPQPAARPYTVCETQPAGFADGTVNPGTGGVALAGGNAVSIASLPGGGSPNNHFGELAGSLSGFVYVDRDDNGQRDAASDPGIPGATVRLLNAATGAVVATATTDATGAYRFTDLDLSLRYTLEEPLPTSLPGLVQGGVNPGLIGGLACSSGCAALPNGGGPGVDRIANIDLSAGLDGAGFNFGERQVSVISGTVYIDRNRNNSLDPTPTDGRLAGVTMTLYAGNTCSGAPLATVQTDASGNFAFPAQLALRPYAVCQTQPVAYADGGVTAGAGGTPLPGGNAIAIASLPATGSPSHLFAERLGSVSGVVFLDPDNNGQQTAGEPGLAGVAITLTGVDTAGQAVNLSTSTDATGAFRFDDLPLGLYTLTQPTQPAGTGNGITTAGSTGGTATPPASLPSRISNLPLTATGLDSSGNRFAEVPANSGIAGRVWLDRNNNGVVDGGEDGLPGVTLVLTGSDLAGRPITSTVTTGADGRYQFASLPPGTYTVTQPDQPAGTLNGRTVPGSAGGTATAPATRPSAISGIVLAVGSQSSDNNFGEIPPAALGGFVWADNDDNGVVGAAEAGLAGVAVVLTGTDDLGQPVNRAVTTGSDGRYRFVDLRPGTYSVTEPIQPAGTVNGKTLAGSAGGTATPVTALPSAIAGVVLQPGIQAEGYNFGELSQSPDLRVSKSHAPATFTVNQTVGYTLRVRNAGDAPTVGRYTLRDRLPVGISLAATPSGSGWACEGQAGDTALACSSSAVLAPGAVAPAVEVAVRVAEAAAAASPVQNAVLVEGGGEIPARGPQEVEQAAFNGDLNALPVCDPAIVHNACREPATVQRAAALSGTVWKDIGSQPQRLDAGDVRLAGWAVEVVDPASGAVLARASTGADGRYRIVDLVPGVPLAVRFRDPASNVVFGYPVNGETAPGSSGVACASGTPAAGQASSCVDRGADPRLLVTLTPGQELPQQSLPVDPSGVVYDSGTRAPVGGSIVTLVPTSACPGYDPARDLVAAGAGGYRIEGRAASMTVGPDGFYQFLLAPTAPASCGFRLSVTPPAGNQFASTAIPPTPGPLLPTGGAGATYPVQPQAAPPVADVGAGTRYYLDLTSGSGVANIIHNHLPLDPALPTGLALSKTGDRAQAEVGDSVRYAITVRVTGGALPRQTTVVDRLPLGFTYIPGTATVDDKPVADALTNPPGGRGPLLAFNLGPMPASGQLTLRYRVRVGVGSMAGDGINRARAQACGRPAGCVDASLTPLAGSVASNEGQHRVKLSGGVFAPEACLAGKVFVDCNHNHVQDDEELGIPGVRLVLEDGTTLVSDSEGKYSHCGLTPQSHVLRVDPLTLPEGARLTTSSNRNLGDAGSLWLDLRNGELHRADFIEGSCSHRVVEQVKARRSQGEVRAPERERPTGPPLRFESKPATAPRQATDGARQPLPAAPRSRTEPVRTEGGQDASR